MPQMLSADSSRATQKIVWGLSLKIIQNDTIYKKNSFGVGGVQNRQAGCLPVAVSGLLLRVVTGEKRSNSSSASGGP